MPGTRSCILADPPASNKWNMGKLKLIGNGVPLVVGMIHLPALPGSPLCEKSIYEICQAALWDAEQYVEAGIDGIIVENMNDIPYVHPDSAGPQVVASMTRVCTEINHWVMSHKIERTILGVQVLAGCNKEALAVAQASGFNFIRAEGYIFAHIADEGFLNACAGGLLRYRRTIGAENISILTDIKKKHSSHSLTTDLTLLQTAEAAEFFLSDGVIITGEATGQPTNPQDVISVKESLKIPVAVGSGVTSENVREYKSADMIIVGSYFKSSGHWSGDVDIEKIRILKKQLQRP